MKLNIFFRLEKAWFGARQKHVSSVNYEFCYGENLTLHHGKQNEKPTCAIIREPPNCTANEPTPDIPIGGSWQDIKKKQNGRYMPFVRTC